MKPTIISIILVSVILFSSCSNEVEYGLYTEAKCPIEIPEELASSGKFLYGYMTVPEVHGQEGSKAIELAVAIFKCRQDKPSGKPLVLNTGGPGMSNIENFVPDLAGPLGNLFLNERDVIIIELRGLEHSKPNLHTPSLDRLQMELLDKNLSAEEIIHRYKEAARSIQQKFTNDGINLSAYNYWETASDISFVMEQLGYEKFFVFGSSAGTILAQYLLMNHADRLAGVIMNAVVNLEPGFNNMCLTTIEKLESIFASIEENEDYRIKYPDLKSRFLNSLAEMNEKPEMITVTFPGKEETNEILLNGDKIAVWLFKLMYWNTNLPESMEKIVNHDFREIMADPAIFMPVPHFSNGSSWSMILNGWEDPGPEQVPMDSEYGPLVEGLSTMIYGQPFIREMRDIWKVEHVPGNIKQLATHVPTLILNGAEDHVCLPGFARDLSDSFETAYCYIFDGVAHSPVDAGECGIILIKQFVDNPGEVPDASCLEVFQKPLF